MQFYEPRTGWRSKVFTFVSFVNSSLPFVELLGVARALLAALPTGLNLQTRMLEHAMELDTWRSCWKDHCPPDTERVVWWDHPDPCFLCMPTDISQSRTSQFRIIWIPTIRTPIFITFSQWRYSINLREKIAVIGNYLSKQSLSCLFHWFFDEGKSFSGNWYNVLKAWQFLAHLHLQCQLIIEGQ